MHYLHRKLGPLPAEVSQAVDENDLVRGFRSLGNRNFEGRINSEVRANYLMSPRWWLRSPWRDALTSTCTKIPLEKTVRVSR